MRIACCDILTVNLGISSSGPGPEEPEVEIFLPVTQAKAQAAGKRATREGRERRFRDGRTPFPAGGKTKDYGSQSIAVCHKHTISGLAAALRILFHLEVHNSTDFG